MGLEHFGGLIGLVVGILILIFLAGWPGRIARRRGHENAMAINVCGWLSIIVWPMWFVAIVWAHTGPDRSKNTRPLPVQDARRGFPMDPIPENWGRHPDEAVDEAMRKK